jgi:hypothetical protein
MYGVSENLELRKDSLPFEVGITNDVVIQKVAFENPKKDGSHPENVIVIEFKNPKGAIFSHKEWNTKGDESKTKSQMIRLKRIVKEITGNDFATNFTSWEDCAQKFIEALGEHTAKLQIKLLYNNKGYLELVRYDSGVRSMSDPTLTLSAKEALECVKKTPVPTVMDEVSNVSDENLDF